MANPLTGDFEAVLQVSGATVNRLLASMHQNRDSKPALPGFPHGVWMRIGDLAPVDGMRGAILAQVSVPRIELIHGVSDRFWLEVSVRARYTPDPGTAPIPEFINGTVRAQYRIDSIDPGCRGWEKMASEYLWIRAIGDTVSFTGTAEDDAELMSIAAWRHIVFSYQISSTVGATVTVQVRLAGSTNAFKDGPHSATYESVTSTKPATLRFGAGHSTVQPPENFFAGRIDNVAFYNAVLAQSDIDKHFNFF